MTATVAANTSVAVPMIALTSAAVGASSNSGYVRAIRYTPAVTIVAAWIRAETGVGPSMASGQPGVERELRGLGEGAHEDQEAGGHERAVVLREGLARPSRRSWR